VHRSVVPNEVDEDDIRVFLDTPEDDLATVRGNVEIPEVEIRWQIRQLRLRSGDR
jgi:hypothetical protein